MLQLCLTLLFLGTLIQAEPYQPGTPGAPWSTEEMAIVKSKLFALFKSRYLPFDSWPGSAQKVLRLAFHDCLRYEDGTGGCDGCLNWEGVGFRYDLNVEGQYPNLGPTDNNGLGETVEILEKIYKNQKQDYYPFDDKTPTLQTSLYESGKSRADLWAFAAIAAVEFGAETNNRICDGSWDVLNYGGGYSNKPNVNTSDISVGWLNGYIQCREVKGQPDCNVNFPRSFKFQTGRKDCTEFGDKPFMATKHEHHPNQQGNGKMTIDFFKEEFSFTGRETVAIMGAHSFGRFHAPQSLYPYVWNSYGESLLNNDYYKILASEDRHYIQWYDCHKGTDAEGNIPKTMWVSDHRNFTKNGGPYFWIHMNYACPNCIHYPDNDCCTNVPEGQYCHADSVDIADDPDVRNGCEAFRFVSGRDEMALPTDVGLYLDFNVTDDGTPLGCPGGFDKFSAPQCDVNKIEEPLGAKPSHEIVEEYAKDQNAWIADFIHAMEKMMSNGYGNGELIDSGYDYNLIKCYGDSREGATNCIYKSEGDGEVRLVDGKHPEVLIHGNWSPICGHYFKDNHHGATLFCRTLNPEFKSGTATDTGKPLDSDGIRIGKCFTDDHWPQCTGGCNDFETGNSCFQDNSAKCSAGNGVSVEIHCSTECDCNPEGTTADFCDMETGQCICKYGFGGPRCDQCLPGFFKNQYLPFFQCDPCDCSEQGSTSEICDTYGQCSCKENVSGRVCNDCTLDHFGYPNCFACGLTSEKGQIFQTFEEWGNIFRIEFDILASRVQWDTSILHLTTGEESVKIPALTVWGTQFVVDSPGIPLVRYGFEIDRKYHFVIEQILEDGIVMFKVIVDGEVFHSQQNNNYNNYNNVIAYVSDPWKDPLDGCLDNLTLTPGKCEDCDPEGSTTGFCDVETGQCTCKDGFEGSRCDQCSPGLYKSQHQCQPCDCSSEGSTSEICDSLDGQCSCKDGFGGLRCDKCANGFFKNQQECQPCGCASEGSISEICDSVDGQCPCKENVSGRVCNECKPNHYGYPNCSAQVWCGTQYAETCSNCPLDGCGGDCTDPCKDKWPITKCEKNKEKGWCIPPKGKRTRNNCKRTCGICEPDCVDK